MEEIEKDMTPRFIEDLGMRFMTEKSSIKYRYGLYECQYCGKEFETNIQSVKCGNTKSCGCLIGKNMTHGLRSNRFYDTWYGMLQRCTNLEHRNYKNYGARGITVCEEWLNVSNFVAWSDKTTQAINQRIQKNNKSGYVGVTYHKKGIAKWRSSIGINNKFKHIGLFLTKEEAVQARDNYIIENKLPHKLSILNTGL